MPKIIPQITDVNNIPKTFKEVAELKTSNNKKTYNFYLFDNKYLILISQKKYTNPTTGKTKTLFISIDLPLGSADWFVNTIEKKFMRGPNEGGLPAGEFSFKEKVDDEELYVSRGASIGGDGIPGYDLMNFSRPDSMFEEDPQSFSMSDELLFENGLMDIWKDLAKKVKNRTI